MTGQNVPLGIHYGRNIRDAGETDWEFDGDIEVDVSWLHTKEGVLPWDVAFVHINGAPDSSLLEMDLLAGFFGLSRSKSDDQKGDYEWNRPDGSITAEYHKWASDEPELLVRSARVCR